jgi:uncharacterized protein
MEKRFGLSTKQFELLSKVILEPLWAIPGVKVWIFGSRARGDFLPYSDIDLLVESTNPSSRPELSRLRATAEDSALPFKVDLVLFEELAEGYRERVLRERVEIVPVG